MNPIQPKRKRTPWGKFIPPRVTLRAYTNVTVDPETGCWVSNYSRTPSGYSTLTIKDRGEKSEAFLGHRASWTHVNGQIPAGMTIDHMCFNKPCVNPAHLRVLSNRDNARRQKGAVFPLGQCSNGHPDSSRKLYGIKKKVWRCSECMDMFNARLMVRQKAERAERRAAKLARKAA